MSTEPSQEKKLKREISWWHALIVISMVVASFISFCVVAAGNIKIGIVDTDKILRESAPAINAQKKIEQEFSPRDEQIKKMAARAETLQEQLENDNLTMSETGRRDMERKLASLSREHQRSQRQMREDFSVRQNEEYGLILEHANQAIKNIAKTEKYDLILQFQDSIYRSERIDITGQVLDALKDQ
jgi:outer membrane protein